MSNEEKLAKQFLQELEQAEKEHFNGLIRKLEDKQFNNIDYDLFVDECKKLKLQVLKGCDIAPQRKIDKKFFINEWINGKGIFIDRINTKY